MEDPNYWKLFGGFIGFCVLVYGLYKWKIEPSRKSGGGNITKNQPGTTKKS